MTSRPGRSFKGVSRNQQVNIADRRDDIRTFGQKMSDWTSTEGGTFAVFGVLSLLSFLLIWAPFIPELIFGIALFIFLSNYRFKKRRWRLPFRVPLYLNKWMRRPILDSTTGKEATGNLFMGMELETGEEVWASTGDVNKHALMIGTTGSGKTEAIMGNVAGFLALGSGALVVDGKASVNTFDSVYKLMRYLGRDPDLFVIDYLTGGKDLTGPQQHRRSHTYNPLSFGGSAQKSEVMVSLMDTGAGGQNDMWAGRAVSFMEGLIPPLSYLHERGHVLMNPALLGEYFSLEVLENLVSFGVIVDRNGRTLHLPTEYAGEWAGLQARMNALRLYINQLPGWEQARSTVPHRTARMSSADHGRVMALVQQTPEYSPRDMDRYTRGETEKQHGFITMQLVRAVANLSENYGFIYNAEIGEISFHDVILNRRSLVVLLPSLERSKSNLEQLGKMTVLSLKTVLGALLNTAPEGNRREIIDGNPSRSKVPFMTVLDEIGYYIVEGISVIPAQARSLGVAVYFGTQDIPSLSRASDAEGKAIIDNTAIKMFGRLASDAQSDTARTAIEMGGKSRTQVADSMIYEKGSLGFDNHLRMDTRSSLQEDYNIAYEDLTQQENGEFHFVVGAKEIDDKGIEKGGQRIVRMLSFYTGEVNSVDTWRRNPYIAVKPPSRGDVLSMRESERMQRKLEAGLQKALDRPNRSLLTAVERAESGAIGQFVAWRAAQIEAGSWPVDLGERRSLIETWLEAEAARERVRRDLAELERAPKVLKSQMDALTDLLGPQAAPVFDGLIDDWTDAVRNQVAARLQDDRAVVAEASVEEPAE